MKIASYKIIFSVPFIAVFAIWLVFSCKNPTTTTKEDTINSDNFSADKEKLNYFKYRFPSSDELFYYIELEDLSFEKTLLNSADNADSYLSKISQALNLGIYLSDLSYISITKRWEEINRYFVAIYLLSDKLHLSGAFDKGAGKRIESNIQNEDSIIDIADEFNDKILDYLVETDNEKLYGIVAFGSLIEYFNIYVNLPNLDSDNSSLIENASDHKYIIENLKEFLVFYEENDDKIKQIITELESLNKLFVISHQDEENDTKVEKLDDGTLLISGGEKITIPLANVDSLGVLTSHIRNRIINGTF